MTYLSRLVKNKDEAVFKLEEKASRFEGDVHRMQEEYREIDNQRQRKFLRTRFDAHQSEQLGRNNALNMSSQGGPRGQNDVATRIATAAGLTQT